MIYFFIVAAIGFILSLHLDFNIRTYKTPHKYLAKTLWSDFKESFEDRTHNMFPLMVTLCVYFVCSWVFLFGMVYGNFSYLPQALRRNPGTKGYKLMFSVENSDGIVYSLYHNNSTEKWLLLKSSDRWLPFYNTLNELWYHICANAVQSSVYRRLASALMDLTLGEIKKNYPEVFKKTFKTVPEIKKLVDPRFRLAYHNATKDMEQNLNYPIRAVFLHIGYAFGSPAEKYFFEQSQKYTL